MLRLVIIYGVIAGALVISSMIWGFSVSDGQGILSSAWFGYLIMLIALSLIFLGIKRYRDTELGGAISFGKALAMGVSIAAVAGVIYVAAWEVYLAKTDYVFIEDYTAGLIEAKIADGVTGDELQAEIAAMEEMKVNYANPLFRVPITFTEIFPLGFLIALISAAILRNPKVLAAQDQP